MRLIKRFTTYAVCILAPLAFAVGPLHAQSADLPLGEPVQEVGSTYIAEQYGAWEVRCVVAPVDQPDPCQLYQLLRDAGGSPVAEFNVFDVPDEGGVVAGASIVTPLGTLLTPGVRMRIDGGAQVEYPFAFCQAVGCFARLGLSADGINSMQSGGVAEIAIVPLSAPDQIVRLTANLQGFEAGFEDLEVRTIAARSFNGLSLE